MAFAVIAISRGRCCRPAPDDLARGGEAVHLGHLHVHQHDVVELARQRLEHLEAVGGDVGAVAHALEHAQRDLLVHGVVLGEQDAQRNARRQLGVDRRGRRPRGPRRGGAAHHAGQRLEELGRLHRLGQAGGEEVARIGAAEGAEQHEGHAGGAPTAQRPRQRDAVHLRHVEIEQGEIEVRAGVDPGQRFGRRGGGARSHAPGLGLQREDAAVGGMVVDDQDGEAGEQRLQRAEVLVLRPRLARRDDGEAEAGAAAGRAARPTARRPSVRPAAG